MTDAQKHRLTTIPTKYQRIFQRVYSSQRPSRKDTLRAKCLDCCCFQQSEAAACTSTTCPLYSVNPYRLATPTTTQE